MPDLTPLTPAGFRDQLNKGLVPSPAGQADGRQLVTEAGELGYEIPAVAVVGTKDHPITDPATPRPSAKTVIWFATVTPDLSVASDLIVAIDQGTPVTHNDQDGRGDADAHPISAITGLTEAIEPAVRLSTFEAAGDLVVGVGNEFIARFPAGATGHVLTVDPQESTGLAWQPLVSADVAAVQTITALERVIIWDNFDRVDGPLGTTPTGHAWTASTNFGILDLTARRTAGTALEHAVVDPGEIVVRYDGVSSHLVAEVSIDTPNTGSKARILFRYIDADNYLFAQVISNSYTALWKRVAGVETQLAQSPQIVVTHSRGIRLRVVVDGTSIVVQNAASGLQIVAHTLTGDDATTFAAQSVVGLGDEADALNRTSFFRDFVVRRLR
jgi:hypothetical protein